MNIVVAGIILYVLCQLGIGLWVSRFRQTEDDYLLAGRSLGIGVVTMSVFATWFGAETCIGTAGQIYAAGFSGGRADPFGYVLCVFLMGLFFAVPLYRMRLTTLGDLFRLRYGAVVEKIAVIILLPASVYWAAAQITAFGHVLSASSDFSIELCILIAAGTVIIYTSMGGLLADATSDVIQGITITIGLTILFIAVIWNWPSQEALQASSLTAERLRFVAPGEGFFAALEVWAVPIIGSLFAQELISRTLAAKSEKVARNACLYASGIYLAIGMIPVVIGMVGPALVPDLAEPDQVLPHLASRYFNTFFYIVFAGALVAAILSTVDSALLAAAALLSHNVILKAMNNPSEAKKVLVSRICVVTFGIIAYLLATRAESVKELMIEASAFGTAGMFASILFAFIPGFGGKWSAGTALLSGLVVYFACTRFFEEQVTAPYVLSVTVAMLGFAAVALFEKPSKEQETALA